MNVGIVTGIASRLVVLDVDDRHQGIASLDALIAVHGPLPATCKATTGNGQHLYFALPEHCSIKNSAGTIGVGIDIRGENGFVVAPGSIHSTGVEYAWADGFGPNDVAIAPAPYWLKAIWDTASASNAAVCAVSQLGANSTAVSHDTAVSHVVGNTAVSHFPSDVEEAILATRPNHPGERNQAVFRLARRLKALTRLSGSSSSEMWDIVDAWHDRALPYTSNTHTPDDTRLEFDIAWGRVRFADGTGPMFEILSRAKAASEPECAKRYAGDDTRLLIKICRELQRDAGDKPFFIGCRTASELLGVDKNTANRRLRLLCCAGGVLQMISIGTKASGKSSEYRYIGDAWQAVRQAA